MMQVQEGTTQIRPKPRDVRKTAKARAALKIARDSRRSLKQAANLQDAP